MLDHLRNEKFLVCLSSELKISQIISSEDQSLCECLDIIPRRQRF